MSVETEVLDIQKKLVKMSSPDGSVSIACEYIIYLKYIFRTIRINHRILA